MTKDEIIRALSQQIRSYNFMVYYSNSAMKDEEIAADFDYKANVLRETLKLLSNDTTAEVVPMDFHVRCLELEVRKRIEAEKDVPHWVSVEDKLPDEKEDVLVFLRVGDSSWVDVMYLLGGTWYEPKGHPCNFPVTHWMGIPEPPQNDDIS